MLRFLESADYKQLGFKDKENLILKAFSNITDKQKIYLKIIDFGKKLPPFDPQHKTNENRVPGCQSNSYLHTTLKNGRLQFTGTSDALISKGLLALLITLYNDEPPETVLTQEPTCLKELNILASISLSRVNGIVGLYTMLRQKAIKYM